MRPALQSKLLQVLQDGEFARLGGRKDVHVDVRIVAATNRDLDCAVANGEFREDLFFRLNVVCITLPPLRQRRDEIPVLTELLPGSLRGTLQQAPHRIGDRHAAALRSNTSGPATCASSKTWSSGRRAGTDDSLRRDLADAIAGRRSGRARSRRCSLATRRPSRARIPSRRLPRRPADGLAQGHRPPCRTRGRTRADLPHAAADALEPPRSRRDPGISYKALLYKIKEAELDKAS